MSVGVTRMKASRRKKQYKRWLDRNATKVMCKYCSMYNTCTHKENKERVEQSGIITRCINTPNGKQKVMAHEKVNKKGIVYNVNKHGIPFNRMFFDETKNRYNSDYKARREVNHDGVKPTFWKTNQTNCT